MPALCLIYAKIIYVKGGQGHQAAAALMAECTEQIAQYSPAVIVYEYGGLDDLSWNKQRREFFHSLHYPDPSRAMEVPVAP